MQKIDIDIIDRRSNTGDPIGSVLAITGLVSAQQPASLSNLAWSNQVVSNDLAGKVTVAHQDALNRLQHSILAQAVRAVQHTGPGQARAAVQTLTGNERARGLVDLQAAVLALKPAAKPAR